MSDLSIYVNGQYYGPARAAARDVAMHSDETEFSLAEPRFDYQGLQQLSNAAREAYARRAAPNWYPANGVISRVAAGLNPATLKVCVKDENRY
jgi:hypothetical protein